MKHDVSYSEFANETGLAVFDDLTEQAYNDFQNQTEDFATWWATRQGDYV